MATYSLFETETFLMSALDAERKAVSTTEPLYAQTAVGLAELLADGQTQEIHLLLCRVQSSTSEPTVWKRTLQGLRDSLKLVSDPVVITATRDFRPTHRTKSPLFRLEFKRDVDAAKKAAEAEAQAEAEQIERAEAERQAQAEAQAEAETSVGDVAMAAYNAATKYGFTVDQVISALQDISASLDAPIAEKPATGKPATGKPATGKPATV